MRLSERLYHDNIKQEEDKKKKARDFFMDEEETLAYAPYASEGFINDRKSVFKGFGDVGINNAESIFDKQAIFRTGSK